MMLYRTITKEHAGVYWKPVLPDGPTTRGAATSWPLSAQWARPAGHIF